MARIEKTVFISYRRTNLPWALAIFQNLKNEGYDVFFDYLSIPSGDFENIIVENIKGRAHFVVILTPSALERCNEPGDWLRREIETAMDEKRNIVPLMLESFDFGSPYTTKALTGKLENLKKYNGLRLHSEYFFEGMNRLREQYLNVSLDAIIHPISASTRPATEEHRSIASDAPLVEKEELTAQEWYERGYVFQLDENLEEAIRCFNESIRLEPKHDRSYFWRGMVFHKIGKVDDAISDYKTAIHLLPEALYFSARGNAYLDKNEVEEAIADFNQAIQINSKYITSSSYYFRGDAYFEKGDVDSAIADYTEAIRLEPNLESAYWSRAIAWEKKRAYNKAIADYQKYLELGGGEKSIDQKDVEDKIKNLKRKLSKKNLQRRNLLPRDQNEKEWMFDVHSFYL